MADLRARYEGWREARERVRLAHAAGHEDELDYARADEEFLDVTSGDALGALAADEAGTTFADMRERHRRMRVAVQGAVVARATRALAAHARSRPDEVELRRELVAAHSERLGRLGYPNARAFAEAQRPDARVADWAGFARALLAATGSAARDAEAALRPFRWDELLSAGRVRAALDFALDGLRLPLSCAPGLELDDEPRPAKRVSARTFAPLVPAEVWLVVAPAPGIAAAEALFSQAGAALHAALTSASLPLESRVLGDPALPLAFARLLAELLAEASFLEDGPGGPHAEALGLLVRARRLAAARRAAALVEVELALAGLAPGTDPRELESLWAGSLESAFGRAPDEAGFLLDCGPELRALDELRARALAAELVRHFRQRHGRRWWTDRAAGARLRELVDTGTTYTAEGLARELDLAPLDADALARALL